MRRRSREGAWIEIIQLAIWQKRGDSRSREGAWIEILKGLDEQQRNESLPRGSVD